MSNEQPQFEQQDLAGSTAHFNGTVGTSTIAVPTSPGNVISEVIVSCPSQTPFSKRLKVSFDGGTTFHTLKPNDDLIWGIKGEVKQIHLQGNVSSVEYEIVMNRESF